MESLKSHPLHESLKSYALQAALHIYGAPDSTPCPANPDNIARGSLGNHFFALQLYKQTRDPRIWADILGYLKIIEGYQQSVHTNNYSLYYGRSGLIYFYLELFHVRQEEKFLQAAVEIAKEFVRSDSRHLRIYDKNGLVDGTAGTLLAFTALHQETKDDWLLDHITQTLLAFLDRAELTEYGLYWTNLGHSSSIHSGWAYGSSGIAFCFLELSSYFNDPSLRAIAECTLRQEEEVFRTGKHKRWIDVSAEKMSAGADPLMEGRFGRDLIRLYTSVLHENALYKSSWQQSESEFNRLLSEDQGERMPAILFNGLAGWGLAFREAYSLTNDITSLDTSHKIASLLTKRLSDGNREEIKDRGFFHGLAGIGYFLAKVGDPDLSPSLLLPRIDRGSANDVRTAGSFGSLPAVKRRTTEILDRQQEFRQKTASMERRFGEELENFLSGTPFVCTPPFSKWIKDLYADRPADENAQTAGEKIEKAILNYRILNKFQPSSAEEDLQFVRQFNEIEKLPDDDLCRLKVSVTTNILILSGHGAFDFSKPLTPSSLSSLFVSYGTDSHIFLVSRFNKVEVGRLDMQQLFIDLFITARPVGEGVKEIMDFVMGQNDEITGLLKAEFKATDMENLRDLLLRYCIGSIKSLLMWGFLAIADY